MKVRGNSDNEERYYKLNKQGDFTHFPGTTIVAKIPEEDRSFWKSLHRKMEENELIKKHFALLPCESYHMTALNLFAKDRVSHGKWNWLMTKKLTDFQLIHRKVNDEVHRFEPTITFDHGISKGVLQLVFNIPWEQDQKLKSLAAEINIPEGIQSYYHITLGYQFRTLSQEQQDKVSKGFNNMLALFSKKPTMLLSAPVLCYFNDMTAFHAWDGKTNPFEPVSTSSKASLHCALFQEKTSLADDDNTGEAFLKLSRK